MTTHSSNNNNSLQSSETNSPDNFNSHNKMNIVEFLTKYEIGWQPIVLDNKVPRAFKDGVLPKTNDNLTNEQYLFRQIKYFAEATHLVIYTDKIQQIDIDHDTDWKLNAPYFESITKKYPHYFVKTNKTLKTGKRTVFKYGDVLTGQWAYCSKDSTVFNSDLSIPTVNKKDIPFEAPIKEPKTVSNTENQIKPIKDNKKINDQHISNPTLQKKEFVDWIDNHTEFLTTQADSSYIDWFKMCCLILNVSTFLNFNSDECYAFVHKFSQLSNKYDDKAINTINNLKPNEKHTTEKSFIYLFSLTSTTKHPDIITYEEKKEEFEKTHVKIIAGPVYINTANDKFLIYSRKNIYDAYDHIIYNLAFNQKVYECPFIRRWLVDKDIRCYNAVGTFPNPDDCPSDTYNTWIDFPVKSFTTTNSEKCKEFINMFNDIISSLCGAEQVCIDYVYKWIAHMLIYPEIKNRCLVFVSEEGAGKGTLMSILSKMIGREKYFETVDATRDVWGAFNGQLMNKLLVNINELSCPDTFSYEGKIKGLITDNKITINSKGANQIVMNSFHRFIITSNKMDPINVSQRSRRLVVFRSDDKLVGNMSFFQRVNELIQCDDCIRSLYDHIINREVDKNMLSVPSPETEHCKDLKLYSKPPIDAWLDEFIESVQNSVKMGTKELFDIFKEYEKRMGFKTEINYLKFAKHLSFVRRPEVRKYRNNTYRGYEIFNQPPIESYV